MAEVVNDASFKRVFNIHDRLAHKAANGLNPRGDCPTDILRLRTRYIITVIPVLNVNAGDDCIHAAAALIQSPPLAPVRPRAPKKGHYSGRTTKAKTVTSLTKGDAFQSGVSP